MERKMDYSVCLWRCPKGHDTELPEVVSKYSHCFCNECNKVYKITEGAYVTNVRREVPEPEGRTDAQLLDMALDENEHEVNHLNLTSIHSGEAILSITNIKGKTQVFYINANQLHLLAYQASNDIYHRYSLIGRK